MTISHQRTSEDGPLVLTHGNMPSISDFKASWEVECSREAVTQGRSRFTCFEVSQSNHLFLMRQGDVVHDKSMIALLLRKDEGSNTGYFIKRDHMGVVSMEHGDIETLTDENRVAVIRDKQLVSDKLFKPLVRSHLYNSASLDFQFEWGNVVLSNIAKLVNIRFENGLERDREQVVLCKLNPETLAIERVQNKFWKPSLREDFVCSLYGSPVPDLEGDFIRNVFLNPLALEATTETTEGELSMSVIVANSIVNAMNLVDYEEMSSQRPSIFRIKPAAPEAERYAEAFEHGRLNQYEGVSLKVNGMDLNFAVVETEIDEVNVAGPRILFRLRDIGASSSMSWVSDVVNCSENGDRIFEALERYENSYDTRDSYEFQLREFIWNLIDQLGTEFSESFSISDLNQFVFVTDSQAEGGSITIEMYGTEANLEVYDELRECLFSCMFLTIEQLREQHNYGPDLY